MRPFRRPIRQVHQSYGQLRFPGDAGVRKRASAACEELGVDWRDYDDLEELRAAVEKADVFGIIEDRESGDDDETDETDAELPPDDDEGSSGDSGKTDDDDDDDEDAVFF